jgi:adenosylhomocysteine nucleosidase
VNSALRTPHSALGPTLVCFALKEEAAPFRKLVVGRADVCVLVTGIGRINTERALRKFFANNSPCRIFTCGLAGGLDPKLVLGEVVFSTSDVALEKALIKSRARQAKFVCTATIASTAAEKQKLRVITEADAVEMESEVVHEICQEREIPCATVRVISDTAHEDLPLDFNQLSNPDQSLNFGKLALTIAKSPGKIPALLRLQKNTSFAAQRLAEVLEQLVRFG